MLSIFKMLGTKGMIGIALIIIFGIQGTILWGYKTKLKASDAELVSTRNLLEIAKSELDDQNLAIRKAGEEKAALDSSLLEASKKNKDLTIKNRQLADELKKKPIPQNCPDQISEIKLFANDLVKEWNK